MQTAAPYDVLVWDSPLPPPNTSQFIILWQQFTNDQYTSEQISLPQYVEQHADRLRKRFLAFVHDVGNSEIDKKSIIQRLQVRETFSYWWITLFASTRWHPASGATDAIKLLALEEILADTKWSAMEIVSTSGPLIAVLEEFCGSHQRQPVYRPMNSRFFQRLKSIFRIPMNLLAAHFVLLKQVIKLRKVDALRRNHIADDIIVFDHFTRFDETQAANGNFESQYWSPVVPLFSQKGWKVSWLHQFVPSDATPTPLSAQNILSSFNHSSINEHALIESRVTTRILVRSIYDYWKLMPVLLKSRHISKAFSPADSTLNLWRLFEDEWYESLCGSTAIRHCLLLSTLEESLLAKDHCRLGIYLMENQPWEMALIHAWKTAGHGRLVGVVHAPIRFWDLRYFSDSRSPRESYSESDSQAIAFRPTPDAIAVNSPNSRLLLESSGISPLKIVDVEALLYQYLEGFEHVLPTGSQHILLLGDFFTELTVRMLSMVSQTNFFKMQTQTILFKPHPVNGNSWGYLEDQGFTCTSLPLAELLGSCSIVFAPSATTGALEAYCANRKVISILDPTTPNYSPLRGLPDATFAASPLQIDHAISNPPSKHSDSQNSLLRLDRTLPLWKSLLN